MRMIEYLPETHEPEYGEWLIDRALMDSFPASDPSSVSQPH